jgi:type IX secretion system PorP/SprF family membrane protein
MYSQYIMNGFLINPSLAGHDGYTTVNLTVREQWVGMEGSPNTYAASFQTRLLKDSFVPRSPSINPLSIRLRTPSASKLGKVGLGGYVFNDNNGIMRRTGIQAAYSYHIAMGQTDGLPNNLAFGLAFTAYQYAINTDGLIFSYDDDPYLNSYSKSVFIPDFNFGTSYTTARYYLGFAMTNLFRGSLLFASNTGNKRVEQGNFYLTGGVKFQLARNWALEPSAFFKTTDMLLKAYQINLSTRIRYKDDYWVGLSLRTNDALILMTGLRYDKFYFAYSFDYTLTDIRKQSFGTHELTLAVKFGENPRRHLWINAY